MTTLHLAEQEAILVHQQAPRLGVQGLDVAWQIEREIKDGEGTWAQWKAAKKADRTALVDGSLRPLFNEHGVRAGSKEASTIVSKINNVVKDFNAADKIATGETGQGLTDADRKAGMKTFEDKVLRESKHYYELLPALGNGRAHARALPSGISSQLPTGASSGGDGVGHERASSPGAAAARPGPRQPSPDENDEEDEAIDRDAVNLAALGGSLFDGTAEFRRAKPGNPAAPAPAALGLISEDDEDANDTDALGKDVRPPKAASASPSKSETDKKPAVDSTKKVTRPRASSSASESTAGSSSTSSKRGGKADGLAGALKEGFLAVADSNKSSISTLAEAMAKKEEAELERLRLERDMRQAERERADAAAQDASRSSRINQIGQIMQVAGCTWAEAMAHLAAMENGGVP